MGAPIGWLCSLSSLGLIDPGAGSIERVLSSGILIESYRDG